jgi:hypothetical protein
MFGNFKKLIAENFPRNWQIELCKEVERKCNLTSGSLSAKVSNYKSLAKINNPSNYSTNSKLIYEKYNNLSIVELEEIIISLI